jgi:hypothetical protein
MIIICIIANQARPGVRRAAERDQKIFKRNSALSGSQWPIDPMAPSSRDAYEGYVVEQKNGLLCAMAYRQASRKIV